MKYLELNQLEIGTIYVCIMYEDLDKEVLMMYRGGNDFTDANDDDFSILGDIRYVLRKET